MKTMMLFCFFFTFSFFFSQEKDLESKFKNIREKGKLEALRQDFKKKNNKQFTNDVFELGKMGGASFTSGYLSKMISERLNDSESGQDFRRELLKKIRSVGKNKNSNGAGFAIVSIDLMEKSLKNKKLKNEHFTEYFQEIKNIINTPSINSLVKGKALKSLAKNNTKENRDILTNALNSNDLQEAKSAGRGILNLLKYAEQSDKDDIAVKLMESIRNRSKKSRGKNGLDKSIEDELLILRSTINAIGRVKTEKTEKFLKDLYYESKNPDLATQILYALSYKPNKDQFSFLIRQTDKAGANEDFKTKIGNLLPAIINDNKLMITDLKTSQRNNDNIMYLRAVALNRDKGLINDVKSFLEHSNPRVRQESIKTLHVIMNFTEKKEFFNKIRVKEKNRSVLWQIEQSIGI
jgi:hypothetical protein